MTNLTTKQILLSISHSNDARCFTKIKIFLIQWEKWFKKKINDVLGKKKNTSYKIITQISKIKKTSKRTLMSGFKHGQFSVF